MGKTVLQKTTETLLLKDEMTKLVEEKTEISSLKTALEKQLAEAKEEGNRKIHETSFKEKSISSTVLSFAV